MASVKSTNVVSRRWPEVNGKPVNPALLRQQERERRMVADGLPPSYLTALGGSGE